jgi:hypothetical protein
MKIGGNVEGRMLLPGNDLKVGVAGSACHFWRDSPTVCLVEKSASSLNQQRLLVIFCSGFLQIWGL